MKKQAKWIAVAGLVLLLSAAALAGWQRARAKDYERQVAELVRVTTRLELQPLQPPPPQDDALVALGEALFFETALSGNRDVSCATCHHPTLALGDELPLSIGTGGSGLGAARAADAARPLVGRNAIALFNVGQPGWDRLFWDGRVQAMAAGDYATPAGEYLPAGLDSILAVQAMFPVTFRDEMRGGWYDTAGYSLEPGETAATAESPDYVVQGGWHDVDIYGNPNELAAIADGAENVPQIWAALTARLRALEPYAALFAAAYPDVAAKDLGFEHAANALAAYQTAAFVAVDTPWDRFLAGDRTAMPAAAVAGALLFFGEAGCAACHRGDFLSDGQFHNIGAPQFGPGTDEDAPLDYGRWRVTGAEEDRFAFRTPPLRNVALTGPWLHNGAYDSLEDVVRHHLQPEAALRTYDGAHLPEALRATVQDAPVTHDAILATLDPLLQDKRRLNEEEVAEIVAFLEALGNSEWRLENGD